MISNICKTILFRMMGWTYHIDVPERSHAIICIAPHTSNWDFIIAVLYREVVKLPSYFLMKRDWFFWPLGPIMRRIGGIPVNRKSHENLTEQLVEVMNKYEHMHVAITPEGTRSLTHHWKRGFYFLAKNANIPIHLYTLDFKHRRIVCDREIIPGDNPEEALHAIKQHYKDAAPLARYPEKFATDSEW